MIRWNWYAENFAQIVELTLAHIGLAVPPIMVAIVLSIPLGFLAARWRKLGAVIVSGTGLLYAIPSLALFVMLPAFLGTSVLSPLNVQIALAAYGVALMTRTAVDAFGAIPPMARDAATAVGYGSLRRVLSVELPLAGPVLLSGARVVSASTVSLVSVGSLVGVHGLGYFFTDGFNRSFPTEILAGVIGTAVVALIFDIILVLFGAVTMPWTRTQSRSSAGRALNRQGREPSRADRPASSAGKDGAA